MHIPKRRNLKKETKQNYTKNQRNDENSEEMKGN